MQSFRLGNAFAIQSRRNPLLAYEVLQTPVGNRAIISYHVAIHATENGYLARNVDSIKIMFYYFACINIFSVLLDEKYLNLVVIYNLFYISIFERINKFILTMDYKFF